MAGGVCARCGGMGGVHGYVHIRHGNGGGHNEPCPVGVCDGFEWDSWSDAPVVEQGCVKCGRRHYGRL